MTRTCWGPGDDPDYWILPHKYHATEHGCMHHPPCWSWRCINVHQIYTVFRESQSVSIFAQRSARAIPYVAVTALRSFVTVHDKIYNNSPSRAPIAIHDTAVQYYSRAVSIYTVYATNKFPRPFHTCLIHDTYAPTPSPSRVGAGHRVGVQNSLARLTVQPTHRLHTP